jgi:hypothetical protein
VRVYTGTVIWDGTKLVGEPAGILRRKISTMAWHS